MRRMVQSQVARRYPSNRAGHDQDQAPPPYHEAGLLIWLNGWLLHVASDATNRTGA